VQFLLDVNASGAVARWLIHLGHDIAEVGLKDPKMSDSEILDWAVKEHRIIITTDNDFEEMIWRQGKPHCGVLRLENLPRSERLKLLRDVLDRHGRDLESGAIVIASSNKFRIRNPSRDSSQQEIVHVK
jgi:predicted nuclease of predicted toxin-antitoxin system